MKKIYIIAGEPSGDFLGAMVIKKMSQIHDIEISGVGGELMRKAGLKSLIDIDQMSVGGILEIIPHIFKIKRLNGKKLSLVLVQ